MKTKRLKILFNKYFKEEIEKYLPGTKVIGLPDDYTRRVLYLLLIYGFYTIMGLTIFSSLAYSFLNKNDEYTYFLSASLIISIFTIILSAVDLVSDYSKSKETNILMTMPIRDEEIYLSKFLAIVLSKFEIFYFYILMILVYIFNMGFSFIKLFAMIINSLPIFVSSVAIISIFIMIIMRYFNINSYKTSLRFVAYGFLLLIFGFIYYYSYRKNGRGDVINIAMKFFNKNLEKISLLFFHTRIYGKSLGGSSIDFIIYSIFLYVYTFLILYILAKLASKIYFDSLIGKEKRKIHKKNKTFSNKKSSTIKAIFKKDLKTIIKSPVYIFSIVLNLIMFTIILGFGTIQLFDLIKKIDFLDVEVYLLIILGSFSFRFLIMANDLGLNSSLSREGESLYQTLTLPISPKENILGRVLSINLVNLIINFTFFLIVKFIIKINIFLSFAIFLGFTLASLISSLLGLLMDANSVNIHWNKERDLIKGSSQNIGYYVICGIIVTIVGVFAYLVYKFTNIYIGFIFVISLILISIIFLYKSILKKYKDGFYDL
ncbi:MAG: ABC transporter permease [Anaerococcus hydrogenalis]|uniref:ABC transporter permease n=1 Tax=Anaerococcus hydrogenalis TaxID=33029 RepID=UPI00290D5A99|nr:ABC transporter permease [Anaerococcus hydrogenalis]MDU3688180.1 ABC transporter permease [Anaerococcus hydrogenalis]